MDKGRPDLIDPKTLQIPESEAMGQVFFFLCKKKQKQCLSKVGPAIGKIAYSAYDHTFWIAEYA